ncbi:GIY-YIG nuclease family protein [Gelidibacter maritimus]|uniref:GIY-YIG nuclease family protein n=1 Tax=Gelidibacter maritimus TaxID=2761487 RepID=A0A7W2M4P1_9FLAO|nr:GIY-YIG nuclease family protein [Gelidibacter maritimus]MBA6152648.1 GIY-YIG nuclease family protein [Gelidibacter maritimus]
MDYTVYILYSQKRSRYYVGQTDNIESRLLRHNKSLVASTKTGVPWDLVFTQTVNSRSEALILEKKIKRRGAKRYIEDNQFGV